MSVSIVIALLIAVQFKCQARTDQGGAHWCVFRPVGVA